jgi:hypothetical protein
MKIITFRHGAHRATVTTDHRGGWVILKVSDGHSQVEIRMTPIQTGVLCDQLSTEQEIVAAFAAAERMRTAPAAG